jgi:acetyl-CoA carboxylase carboxyl transferase subunit alpha
MRITAQDLKKLGLLDEIVAEPMGGAQREPALALASLAESIAAALAPLRGMTPEALKARRRDKFLAMGKLGLA